jgi:hypothetical protein
MALNLPLLDWILQVVQHFHSILAIEIDMI